MINLMKIRIPKKLHLKKGNEILNFYWRVITGKKSSMKERQKIRIFTAKPLGF